MTPYTGGRALRPLPGTPQEWTRVIGQVSGLMLALVGAQSDGHDVPEPLGRPSARAWGRVAAALRPPAGPVPSAAAVVRTADLEVLGAAAQALGRELCRHRARDVVTTTVAVLLAEAAEHDRAPEHLVAQLARVHGVLDADGPDADELWRAAG